jgi:hypothetical protein
MIGYKLDTEQKDLLVGQQFAHDQYFNPVPDINGVYFIFEGEVDECVNQNFMWVKTLQQSEYVPPINIDLP